MLDAVPHRDRVDRLMRYGAMRQSTFDHIESVAATRLFGGPSAQVDAPDTPPSIPGKQEKTSRCGTYVEKVALLPEKCFDLREPRGPLFRHPRSMLFVAFVNAAHPATVVT